MCAVSFFGFTSSARYRSISAPRDGASRSLRSFDIGSPPSDMSARWRSARLRASRFLLWLHLFGEVPLDQRPEGRGLAFLAQLRHRIATVRYVGPVAIGALARVGEPNGRIVAQVEAPPRAAALGPIAQRPTRPAAGERAQREPAYDSVPMLDEASRWGSQVQESCSGELGLGALSYGPLRRHRSLLQTEINLPRTPRRQRTASTRRWVTSGSTVAAMDGNHRKRLEVITT